MEKTETDILDVLDVKMLKMYYRLKTGKPLKSGTVSGKFYERYTSNDFEKMFLQKSYSLEEVKDRLDKRKQPRLENCSYIDKETRLKTFAYLKKRN